MTDPQTLGELLEWLENEDSYGLEGGPPVIASHLRRILYGEECGHEQRYSKTLEQVVCFRGDTEVYLKSCPGHTGGLVERVRLQLSNPNASEWYGYAAALRKETGEP